MMMMMMPDDDDDDDDDEDVLESCTAAEAPLHKPFPHTWRRGRRRDQVLERRAAQGHQRARAHAGLQE
jgi:hypothetical protein